MEHLGPRPLHRYRLEVCHFNHTAAHGGQSLTQNYTEVHWPLSNDPKVLCRVNYHHSLHWPWPVQVSIHYSTVTDRWHGQWQLRWRCIEVGSGSCVLVLFMWSESGGQLIDSPVGAAAPQLCRHEALSRQGHMSLRFLTLIHTTHTHTDAAEPVWREEREAFIWVWINIEVLHQNEHCRRALTLAVFELIEAWLQRSIKTDTKVITATKCLKIFKGNICPQALKIQHILHKSLAELNSGTSF